MGYKESNFWRFFRSVKLTIILLVVMAIFALIGTLIPQREEAARAVPFWDPKILEIFFRLGLFDLYHSFVFRLLLLGLAINIVVCSLDRLPKSIKLATHSLGPAPDTVFERPIVALRAKEMEARVMVEKLKKALRLFGGKAQIADLGNRIYGHSEYGRLSYFGVYVVHLSVLVILIGGIIGSIWGFEGYVNILEGDAIDTVELRDGKGVLKLGYSIR
ncbi:MAG: cytochrome c biogenesis protein ResB, partial [Desulfatiglandales bacterium]